jgi:hypothetical protein
MFVYAVKERGWITCFVEKSMLRTPWSGVDQILYSWNRRRQILVTMIGSGFLNFEDEIYLWGVECNIPPVSIGILPVDRARGLILRKESLMEIFIMWYQLNTDKVSMLYLTRLRQGQIGNCTQRDIYWILAQNIFITIFPFSL